MAQRPGKAAEGGSEKSLPGGGWPETYGSESKVRTKIFISYSHKDKISIDRLLFRLRPLERIGLTEVWVDTRLKSGEKWRDEIRQALSVTKVAILLVGIDFITSDFIANGELPPLLRAAKRDGVLIAPVFVRACFDSFGRTPALNQFQGENEPESPLSALKYDQREAFWGRLAGRIEDFLSGSAEGGARR